jgi:RNA polymerase sigma-32 factor
MNPSLSLVPLPPIGSLDSYIQAVNRIPMLTAEEELTLARRFRDDDDLEAARTLVLAHLRLVVAIARGYLGYGLPHADLIQEGSVGLMKAVKRFDPERGVRLVSFAVHWIKAEIHEFILRNWRMLKIATTKAQRKLFFNLRSLRTGSGSMSEEAVRNVAAQLQVKPEEVREMETRMYGQDVSLEPAVGEEDEVHSPIAYLSSGEGEPSEILETTQLERLHTEALREALGSLDDRSRRIIEARWLVDDKAATLHDLADEFGVSAERVRQIEARALQKMRERIAA